MAAASILVKAIAGRVFCQYLRKVPKFGKCPIYLVGHSIGDLVIKGTLNRVWRQKNEVYSQLMQCYFNVKITDFRRDRRNHVKKYAESLGPHC